MLLVWVWAVAAAKGRMALVGGGGSDRGFADGNRGHPHSSSRKNGGDDGSSAGPNFGGDLGIIGRATGEQQRITTTDAELVPGSGSEIVFEAA